MKIIYYVDSSDSVNWGGQATSAGIRHLVTKTYPDAEFVPTKFRILPFNNATFLRKIPNLLVYWCIRLGWINALKNVLHWYGIDRGIYKKFDVVCFNGEGAIHEKSGHFFRLLGSLYAFKMSGVRVYSLNQTIDVRPHGLHAKMLQMVYPTLDRVAVREPTSLRLMENLGINCELIGDAAYALPLLSTEERQKLAQRYNLDRPFIAITASSAMKRNSSSAASMKKLLNSLSGLDREIVYLANTKTDLYLAKRLSKKHKLRVIDYNDATYREAIAIISKADLIVGGRQHPNIFAAKYGVPFIGLAGNTHKMNGVAELLDYPVPVFKWSFKESELRSMAIKILSGDVDFSRIKVPTIESIDLVTTKPSSTRRDCDA